MSDIIKGKCPNCGNERNTFIRGKHRVRWSDENVGIDGSTTCYILECCGCETMFFREDEYFSENVDYTHHPITGDLILEPNIKETYWLPLIKRQRPDWLYSISAKDDVLGSLLDELYLSLDNDLSVLAAIGIRTSIDRATELLKIPTKLSFAKKLDELVDKGWIGQSEKDILEVLIDAGSAAAHRAWSPSSGDLKTLMDVLEQFLNRNILLPHSVATLKPKVPSRS